MATDLSAIADGVNGALSLSNLILVSPKSVVGYQPQNAPSWSKEVSLPPPALLFNYEGEQSAELVSDVTDHFIENNTAIQDQVALKPITIRTKGFIGELNNVPPAALKPIKAIADKLVAISAYTPQISETAALAYANAFQLYQVGKNIVNSAVRAWSTINGSNGQTVINGSTTQAQIQAQTSLTQTQQQIYFAQFCGYWQSRTLFTVQTPWAVFQDMIIMNLRAVQDEDTRMISTFEVQFKQMRFASTQLESTQIYDNANFQGRAGSQGASEVDLGTSTLQESPTSFSSMVA
jgi:hypothetical protein